ncbi:MULTISPECIES: PaaI family thioesterase [Sphingomonas]|uniref:PaaI family thioesterase n=1 Tax=Sphingomonas TaxID=13687 RepID=UPI000DEFF6A5|nr:MULTISPECIES: PaaI family thioesterase [Sphingomonas]
MIDLPPYARLLGLRADETANGTRFVMPWHGDVVGRPLFLHGGAIAGLLEFAAFTSLREALAEADEVAAQMKPITVTVTYLLGGRDRETYAEAVVERLGRTVANVDAVAWQETRERPIATARINFLLERQ